MNPCRNAVKSKLLIDHERTTKCRSLEKLVYVPTITPKFTNICSAVSPSAPGLSRREFAFNVTIFNVREEVNKLAVRYPYLGATPRAARTRERPAGPADQFPLRA